ncbi:hypothetical protein [Bacillus dakarensis]|uniref:hypothetical protein n=1 Tax=Robertmurraya dakarensis TaxID=1926278 RepID=UPI0009FC01AF|nr:hypothetical protein [Bacillus dakarensis]
MSNEKKDNEKKVDEKRVMDDERFFDGMIRINIANVEDQLFDELNGMIGKSILVVTNSDQLNLFGQTFRPIFCGTIIRVTQGDVTLFPVNIKMINAPFYQFPTPLSIPLEKISHFSPDFDCNDRIPLT